MKGIIPIGLYAPYVELALPARTERRILPTVRRTAIVLLSMTVLAGCGGGEGKKKQTPPPRPTSNADLLLPAHVPRRARGAADSAKVRVIAGWLRALRSGDEARAARYWATGAKFQNATPVLTIDTPIEKLAIQKSLPCGAKIAKTGGPDPFVVIVFVLTNRPGGNCGSGAGATARGAIRVAHGRIAEWYRLPDDPAQAQPDAALTQGGPTA